METEKQDKKQYDWLKPYQFKPGQSGNPGGKKPGTKSLKVWLREYFQKLDDAEKMEFFKNIDPEMAWKMAEGNPQTKTDLTSGGEKIEGNSIVINSNGKDPDIEGDTVVSDND